MLKTGLNIYLRVVPLLILALATACAPRTEPGKQPAAAASEATPGGAEKRSVGSALLIRNKPGGQTVQIERVDLDAGGFETGVEAVELGKEVRTAFSPDGRLLAVTARITGCRGECLRLFALDDLRQTASVDLPYISGYNEWVSQLAFDAQSAQVVVTSYEGGKVAVVDFAADPAGKLHVADLAFQARLAAFGPDGKQVMMIGVVLPESGNTPTLTNPTLTAALLDVQTMEVVWQQDLPGLRDGYYGSENFDKPEDNYYYTSGMAVDEMRERVYIAHADADRLTTVDFHKRSVAAVDIQAPKTSIERIVEFFLSIGVRPVQAKAGNNYTRFALLSGDGRTLYVGGSRMVMTGDHSETTPLGLEAWDIASAQKLLRIETDVFEMRQAPGGRILLSGYDPNQAAYHPYTEIFDPELGRITARLEDTSACVTLSVEGQPLVVSAYFDNSGKTFLGLIDADNRKSELFATQNGSYAHWPEAR